MKEGNIRQVRIDAMLQAHSEGLISSFALEQAADSAVRRLNQKVGLNSEIRFDIFVSQIRMVKTVRYASSWDDAHKSVDRWVTFKDEFGLPELPVQIKSSNNGVSFFKFGDPERNIKPNREFQKRNGEIIVVNCGYNVTQRDLIRQLQSEMKRVKLID